MKFGYLLEAQEDYHIMHMLNLSNIKEENGKAFTCRIWTWVYRKNRFDFFTKNKSADCHDSMSGENCIKFFLGLS